MNNAINTNDAMSEMNNWQVTGTDGKSYRRGDLDNAFKKVQNSINWKMPVDSYAVIADDAAMKTMHQAIIFFTGSVPKFEKVCDVAQGTVYSIKADGYYVAIGA